MLSIGMSYELYWYGDPLAAKRYFEADKLRQERTNADAWLQGVYMAYAIQSTIGNAFLGKSKPPFEYPKEPLFAKRIEDEKEAEREKREKQEAVVARLYMENMIRAGKNWGKKPT